MKDNRGLTLVELLITVTILALVIAGAATFMLAGSKSFAKGSADSNVQGEAELAVNQIEDLVIDVNGGVDYVIDDAADTESLVMYHVEADNSGVTVNKKRTVTWDRSEKNIYSGEWTVDKDGSGAYVETSTVYANQLLAENVTDFNVDLSDKYTETGKDGTDIEIVRSVVIRVDCLDSTGKSTYATTPTITLRNRLMLSASPDEIFQNTPTPDESLLLYISDTGMEGAVPVRDRVTTVERGKVYNIFVMVNVGTNVNSLCNFTVEGETTGTLSSITPTGVHIALDVNSTEPNDYLKITASYITNPSKKVSGWVRVIGGNSKSLDSVSISTEGWNSLTPKFTAHPQCTNFTPKEIEDLQYTWSVTEPERMEDGIVYTQRKLNLQIKNEDDNYGRVFTITVVCYSSATNQSVSASVLFRCNKGGGDPMLERGKAADLPGNHGDVWNTFPSPFYPKNITYKYYFCDIYGNKTSAHDSLLPCIVLNVGDGNYNLTFSSDLPPENEYYIKVEIYYETWEKDVWDESGHHVLPSETVKVHECIHYIPAVSLWGIAQKESKNALNTGFNFTYEIQGYYELEWANSNPPVYKYEVVDMNAVIPNDITVTPTFGKAEARTTEAIETRCAFDVKIPGDDWSRYGEIELNSMVIRVSMKDHPSIYSDITIIFE